jgi:hypothetical protein
MPKPKRIYETKTERARRLPVGTWFVWPDTLPRRHKYYQPRVYRALGGGSASKPVYEEFGMWEHKSGLLAPQAAYDRAIEVAGILNGRNADEHAATAYVKALIDVRARGAAERVGELLRGTGGDAPMADIYVMTAQKLYDELTQLKHERRDWCDLEVYVEVIDRKSYAVDYMFGRLEGDTPAYEVNVVGEGSAYRFEVHTPVDRDGKEGEDYTIIACVEPETDEEDEEGSE